MAKTLSSDSRKITSMPKPATPLLSVVIPTYERPQFLPRAIDTARQAAPDGEVEVIVVPNGLGESWKQIAEQFKSDSRVRWHPIATPHANAARNHGMKLARGEFIRFLDDDDYFYPQAACIQLTHLVDCDADLSCARVDVVDCCGGVQNGSISLEKDDFLDSVLCPIVANRTSVCQPTALVYRRYLTHGLEWDTSVNKMQDVYWLMSLCERWEMAAVRFNQAVGAWVQHDHARVSKGHHPANVAKEMAESILALTKSLSLQGRMNDQRARAAADHLWQRVHQGLMYDPAYWIGIAKQADALAPNRRPPTSIHRAGLVRFVHPLKLELAIVPWRWLRVLFGHEYTI